MALSTSQVDQAEMKASESHESLSGTENNLEQSAQLDAATQSANSSLSAILPIDEHNTSTLMNVPELMAQYFTGLRVSRQKQMRNIICQPNAFGVIPPRSTFCPRTLDAVPSIVKQVTATIQIKPDNSLGNNLSYLSDACLGAILSKLSLQERFCLRIICSRWRTVIQQSFASPDFKSLKLFDGYESLNDYLLTVRQLLPFEPKFQLSREGPANDDLVLNSQMLEEHITNTELQTRRNTELSGILSSLYPSIQELVVAVDRRYYSDQVFGSLSSNQDQTFHRLDISALLAEWPNLTSLTIMHLPPTDMNSSRLATEEGAIWRAVSAMTSLTSLHLFEVYSLSRIPLEVLFRLKQLTISDRDVYYNIDLILPHLKQCTELNFPLNFCSSKDLDRSIEQNPHLTKNLTRLTYNCKLNDKYLFSTVCHIFKSLQFLQVPLDNLNQHSHFELIIFDLANLTQLRELRIGMRVPIEIYNIQLLPVLPSIKILYLNAICADPAMRIPEESFYDALQHTLPNLEEIRFACRHELVLENAKQCFTKTNFPMLKYTSFVTSHPNLFSDAYQYMGEHADRFKAYLERNNGEPALYSFV